jgi:hypothetical protein
MKTLDADIIEKDSMTEKSKKKAFLVKDPKTYLNIEEARYFYSEPGDKNLLFIILPKSNPKNVKQMMQNLVSADLWDEIIWIDTYSNGLVSDEKARIRNSILYKNYMNYRELLFNLIDRWVLDKISKKYAPVPLVVSTHKNTQEHLATKLRPDKLVIVDSGHRIFKRINGNGYIDYSRQIKKKSRFTRLIHNITGLKVFDRKKTTLFTVYADEIKTNHKIDKNSFSYQKYLFQNRVLGDNCIWISTPIYKMVKGVRLDDYIKYIEDYVDHLNIDRSNLIYIPHPGKQTSREIEEISKKLNCRIDDRDIPVERKITGYEKLPSLCISPFSSALVNIHMASSGRIKTISAWHREFSAFEIWENWKNDTVKNSNLDVEFLVLPDCTPLFNIDETYINNEPKYKAFKDWQEEIIAS